MLADGTKATANGQFVIGEGWCAVPVVVNKKAKLGFIVWMSQDGEEATAKAAAVSLGLTGVTPIGKWSYQANASTHWVVEELRPGLVLVLR